MSAGSSLPIGSSDGVSFVALDKWLLGPSEVLVMANQSAIEAAGQEWKGNSGNMKVGTGQKVENPAKTALPQKKKTAK
jgi:hypothetical protein